MRNKEEDAVYQLNRYNERMQAARNQLGGCCVQCGSEEDLEIDHIDPDTKSFTLSHKWSVNEEIWQEELAKCQLLCRKCHEEKTSLENPITEEHGTWAWANKRKCKCDECRELVNNYHREYKRKKKGN